MNLNKTEIVVVLDRSGSMASMVKDVIPSFARFVKAQREQPSECVLTLVQFNSMRVELVHEAMPIDQVPELKLEPYGGTPLIDALASTIDRVGRRLRNTRESQRPSKVLFLVITDGEENSSTLHTLAALKAAIKEQEEVYNWSFMYIGANVDAFHEASSMGIYTAHALNYTPASAGSTFDVLNNKVSTYRALTNSDEAKASLELTDEERAQAATPTKSTS